MPKRWMKEPKYRKAYSALEDELAVAKAVIAARNRAGLTQMETRPKDGNDAAGCRQDGGRAYPDVTANSSTVGTGERFKLTIRFESCPASQTIGQVNCKVVM